MSDRSSEPDAVDEGESPLESSVPIGPAGATEGGGLHRWTWGLRHPVRSLTELTGNGPAYALLVLFGLNAVDELDRTAFGILLPEIRDEFDLDLQGVLTLIAVVYIAAFALQVPIATLADRHRRVPIAVAGAAAWGLFSLTTGLAVGVVMLTIVRCGSSIGRAVVDPTHNSLLADYFEPSVRPRVYSFHRAANAVGQFLGPLLGGLLAFSFGWRVPFLIFAVPTFVLVVLALRLREPVRGAHERRAMGASEEAVATEEDRPSFAEGWRMVWKVESLRRIWYAIPFLAAALVGYVALAGLLYEEAFGLDERARGFVAASVEPMQLLGLVVGARVGTRLIAQDPGKVLRFVAVVAVASAALALGFAISPVLWLGIVINMALTAALAILLPGILASLSLAIPARARSIGFSVFSLWVIPGLLILPLIGGIADAWGIRFGLALMAPIFLIGGLIISTAGSVIARDIQQVWATAAARSEVAYERRQGRSKLLLVRGVDVSYDDVQVLFGVDFEVDEGEIVALLGTNGAGKSTLLKAISGVVEADRGAVIFDGREITHAPPNEVAARGVTQVPGGTGVFPSLSVGENLRVAGWLERRDRTATEEGVARVLELFPVLGRRLDEPAANLSGGQQQMLALGMAFLSRPRLLMIDELSLGLAPVVVEQLLTVVEELRDAGTTIILVEQSVNVALTVASTAYFMEKGEIRFHGPTAELLERPDVLRSVFLEGAAAALHVQRSGGDGAPDGPVEDGARAVDGDRSAKPAPATAPTEGDGSPALSVRGVARSFGGIRALDDVTLAVAPGEIVGIIGPNGAGKTTLFDVVSGFTPSEGGSVLLGGDDITGLSPDARARRGLGRSFQDARLFPALTVAEALAVALERWTEVRDPLSAALHLPTVFDSEEKVHRRVEELLELMGLGAFRTKFIHELSTGSRRIVDLACVVAHRPTVVLLDEPSSGIAQKETEALGPLLRRIREGLGAALVVIEHDMPLVTALSDRMIAMDQGRVIAEGSPSEILVHPDVVASYLGSDESVIARSGSR
jgi:ABC-type branched-subunit amino acid transport system ATPase component/predicted MFS family arabinose efflux permease